MKLFLVKNVKQNVGNSKILELEGNPKNYLVRCDGESGLSNGGVVTSCSHTLAQGLKVDLLYTEFTFVAFVWMI